MDKNKYLQLGGIIILGLVLRFLVFASFAKNPAENFLPGGMLGDAYWYDKIALNIMHGRGFSAAVNEPYEPDPVRTPAYPLFLAAVYSLFGHHFAAAIIFQIFISLITCVIVFRTGCMVFGDCRAGIIAAFAFAAEPDSLFISNHLLTETLFTFLIASAFFLITRHSDGSPIGSTIGSFSIMAVASLTRPVFIYFPVIVAAFMIGRCFRPGRPKNCIATIVVSLLLYFVLVSTWCYRNYRTFRVFEISPISSVNLFYYYAAGIESQRLGISIDEAKIKLEETYLKNEKNIDSLNYFEKMVIARKYATKHIVQYPKYFIKVALSNLVNTFMPQGATIKQVLGKDIKTGLRDIFEREGVKGALRQMGSMDVSILILFIGMFGLLLLINIFTIIGMVQAVRAKKYYISFLFLATIGYLIIVPMLTGFSDARFRIPAVPFMCLFAGYGLVNLNFVCGRERKAV